ncbi:gas vesicle protein [Streptomonospora nanhaiensis]|uniref:gas vesicle protein GvpO n=1 Tax=Streptomonospora nanhaiensis TaxID=1323731 RepID=UPI001C388C65|nr:gas vesicle protein [Streptomonospora nanhaiensis]MBV2365343.1 gas vesicle protein [Streptomonospora nanhaiensis]MBX9389432.1 gas vesicle protein [Streptomonospora nanhaiensis]
MSQDSNADENTQRRGASGKKTVADRLNAARLQFEEVTGIEVESVSGIKKSDEGWTVTLEALELRRVPDTVSLLATYTVDIDADGDLVGYERLHRYTRGRSDSR